MELGKVISLIRADKHYGVGKYMEIAKGRNEYTTSFLEGWRKFKRMVRCP